MPRRSRPYIVKTNQLPILYFRPGEPILATGIYRVFHGEHRVCHEVTLLAGEVFPKCAECGEDVHFQLLREAPLLNTDGSFRVRLYQVPHPAKEEAEPESAAS